MDTQTADFTITAPSSWMKYVISLCASSTQPSQDSSESVSFLSCILFRKEDGVTSIHAESDESTAYIQVEGEGIEVKGKDIFSALIKAKDLMTFTQSMPDDGDVVLSINDGGEYSVVFGNNEIVFSSTTETITSQDATPSSEVYEDGDACCNIDIRDLIYGYKMGSAMAKPKDKGIDTKFDVLSGCFLTLRDNGLYIMSASASSSEVYIPAKTKNIPEEESVSTTTLPDTTLQKLSKIDHGEVILSIDDDGFLHISSDSIHICITPMNAIGKQKITYDTLVKVLDPAWKNRVVTAEVPAKQLNDALSRANSVQGDLVRFSVSSSQMKVTAKSSSGKMSNPFSQKISCVTTWHDDEEAFFEITVNRASLKRIYTMASESGSFIFDISIHPKNSTPWAIIVHTGKNFNPDDPHNFFMLNAIKD